MPRSARRLLYRVINAGWLPVWGALRSRNTAETDVETGEERPKNARRLSIQYASDLALAYVFAVTGAAAILIPLRSYTSDALNVDFARNNTTLVVVLVAVGNHHGRGGRRLEPGSHPAVVRDR